MTFSTTNLSLAGFVAQIIGVFNAAIPLLIGVCIVIFFVGLVRFIYNTSDAKSHTQGIELIKWGLIAMFVLMSLWGILTVAKDSLFP